MFKPSSSVPTPVLKNRSGHLLNEISLSRDSAGINIHVDATGESKGTPITAYFNVLEGTDWSEVLPKGDANEVVFLVTASQFNRHVNKVARVKCSIKGVDSATVSATIVE